MSLVRKLENRKGRLNSDRQFDSRGMKRLDYKNIHPLYWRLYDKVYFIFFILGSANLHIGIYFWVFILVVWDLLLLFVKLCSKLLCLCWNYWCTPPCLTVVVIFLIAVLCSNITRSCCPFWPQIWSSCVCLQRITELIMVELQMNTTTLSLNIFIKFWNVTHKQISR